MNNKKSKNFNEFSLLEAIIYLDDNYNVYLEDLNASPNF